MDFGIVGKSIGSLLAPHFFRKPDIKKKKKNPLDEFSDWLQKIYNTQQKLVL